VDKETGNPVDREHQVKGYAIGPDEYIMLQPDEIAEAVPEGDKTLRIEAFIP
jgi:DNA end-binding protein Ku